MRKWILLAALAALLLSGLALPGRAQAKEFENERLGITFSFDGLELAPNDEPTRVLDIGTGNGAFALDRVQTGIGAQTYLKNAKAELVKEGWTAGEEVKSTLAEEPASLIEFARDRKNDDGAVRKQGEFLLVQLAEGAFWCAHAYMYERESSEYKQIKEAIQSIRVCKPGEDPKLEADCHFDKATGVFIKLKDFESKPHWWDQLPVARFRQMVKQEVAGEFSIHILRPELTRDELFPKQREFFERNGFKVLELKEDTIQGRQAVRASLESPQSKEGKRLVQYLYVWDTDYYWIVRRTHNPDVTDGAALKQGFDSLKLPPAR